MKKKDAFAEKLGKRLLRQINRGKPVPWQKPWKAGAPRTGGTPYNPTTNKPYKGGNGMLLRCVLMERGLEEDARFLTEKQGLAQGATLREGERDNWVSVQYFKRNTPGPAADEGEAGDDDTPADKPMRRRPFSVFYAKVYHASSFDGLPPPAPRPAPPEGWRHAEVERLVKKLGVPVNHEGGDRAFYRPGTDSIHLPDEAQFKSRDAYLATLLHECGHATGHHSRLDRDLSGRFGSESYAKEELRAEIASMLAGERLGIGHDPSQHVAYLKSWAQVIKNDPQEVVRACRDAEKILDYLGVVEPEPVAVLEQSQEQEARAAFVREFDLVLQRDYFITAADAGLDEAEILTYRDSGSAQDAVADYARECDLDPRGPYDPKPAAELLAELDALRAQRDRLAGALREVITEPEPTAKAKVAP